MKANAAPLPAIFEKKLQLEAPLFQRQYVWKREQQWEPLWEDIARKFTEYLEGRKDAVHHFAVLSPRPAPSIFLTRKFKHMWLD
ncbi:MAG TPA: DUF262 domain-containing protein [Pyrinomonadaceae bacterium]|nr:DUF262 domain-containing protein [Pyrinomonadaceae bacterium]